MPASAELFRKRSQILFRGRGIPGIGTNRNFRTHGRRADTYRIAALRKEQIGDELVVALQIQITHVKKYNAILGLRPLPQYVDGALVPFEQRAKRPRNNWKFPHFRHWPRRELRNYPGNKPRFGR